MPTGTLSPIFQFAIANRVFNYNEHNGSRHQPPLSRPILPPSPSFIPRYPSALSSLSFSVNGRCNREWHPAGSSPSSLTHYPSMDHYLLSAHSRCRLPSERYSVFTIIIVVRFLSISRSLFHILCFYFSPTRAIASLRSFSFPFSLSLISRAKNRSDNRSSIANDKHFMPADALYPKLSLFYI